MAPGRAILAALALGWLVPVSPVAAEDGAFPEVPPLGPKREVRQLYAACSPMELRVTISGADEAADIGITEDAVQAVAESRLRAARLYLHPSDFELSAPILHALVHVVSPAFRVALELDKFMLDPLLGSSLYSTTWRRASLGTHAGNAAIIRDGLSQHLDHFIADYLRVNESACSP